MSNTNEVKLQANSVDESFDAATSHNTKDDNNRKNNNHIHRHIGLRGVIQRRRHRRAERQETKQNRNFSQQQRSQELRQPEKSSSCDNDSVEAAMGCGQSIEAVKGNSITTGSKTTSTGSASQAQKGQQQQPERKSINRFEYPPSGYDEHKATKSDANSTASVRPQPYVIPTTTKTDTSAASKIVSSSAPATHESPGIGTLKQIVSLPISRSPNSNNSNKRQIVTVWNRNKAQPTSVMPPPLTARPRSDTWDVNSSQSQVSPQSTFDSQHYSSSVDDANGVMYNDESGVDVSFPSRLAAAKASASQQAKSVALIKSNLQQQSQYMERKNDAYAADPAKYTVQDQWKMLWTTQANNLADPADVLAVIDTLIDKTVNRLSPVQITFIQRKVRYSLNRLYNPTGGMNGSTHGSTTNVNSKKIFGVGSNKEGVSTGTSNGPASFDFAEARAITEKNYLLPENVVRHMILPNIGYSNKFMSATSTVAASTTNPTDPLFATITNNIVTLMLALSSTTSESYLWDRTAFAATAGAEHAGLEMDVNKKFRVNQAIPKPSHVPIIEGAAQFAPGITLTAFCAILSIAISSSSTRQQKLQLFFYLCFQPEQLVEFIATHPAGGVATWLLEVGNDVVLSLSSLTHYHYFGHSFLPTFVPNFQGSFGSSNAASGTTTNSHDDQDDDLTVSTAPTRGTFSNRRKKESKNGVTGSGTDHITTKRRFVPSLSRQPLMVSFDRVQTIVQTIIQIEQKNVNDYQEKILEEQLYDNRNNDSTGTSNSNTKTMNSLISENHSINGNQGLLGSNSTHKGKKGRWNTNQAQTADTGDTSDVQNGNRYDQGGSCFTLTETMKRLMDASSMKSTLSSPGTTDHNGTSKVGAHFCYPANDATTLSPLAMSRDQFLAGTSVFVQNHYGMKSVDSNALRSIFMSMEEFVQWADTALDDLALNTVLFKVVGEGILPSPAMERDLVLTKWLQWERTIGSIVKIANINNRIPNVSMDSKVDEIDDDLDDDQPIDVDGYLASSQKERNKQSGDELIAFSSSMKELLFSSYAVGLFDGNKRLNEIQHIEMVASLSKILQGRTETMKPYNNSFFVWGGLGAVDGGGGLGYGVLYCVSKDWWNEWCAYTGWTLSSAARNQGFSYDKGSKTKQTQNSFSPKYGEKRPWSLSTESLLENDHDSIIRGSMGFYEVMRSGLVRERDYVLVPPCVWDVLYELYGGGPPLPRMIRSPDSQLFESDRVGGINGIYLVDGLSEDGFDSIGDDELIDVDKELEERSHVSVAHYDVDEVEVVPSYEMPTAKGIPNSLSVALHPWIIHVQLCDPSQPYRRGDTGPVSIRVMATPYQPLWRFFAEILCRFSFHPYKAYDPSNGRGKVRLWKRTEPISPKEPVSRYGPWILLCKNRHAILPFMSTNNFGVEGYHNNFEELISDWKEYSDNATVETCGLSNNDHLMLEFTVQNKTGQIGWPREAAAKAGHVRLLAEEDRKFRNLMKGLGDDGSILLKPPSLVGLEVDALDSTGRWYTVKIIEVEIVDDDTEEEVDDEVDRPDEIDVPRQISRKKAKVLFSEHGNHTEWIDVESDRLATAGRFASQSDLDGASIPPTQASAIPPSNSPQSPDAKSKALIVTKKPVNANDVADNAKICTLPGLGACGLLNLGNTCYMNSALQCISYLPILRSYLISGQYKVNGDLNKDNVLGSGAKLLEETAELMRAMWNASLGERSPSKFRLILGKTNSQFSGADQQDAQEFLNYIIDVLHEDSYKGRKKPYVEPLEDDWVNNASLARVGEEAWRRFLRRNRSVMADVAMGQALNTVTCPVCNHSSRNFDPFNLLSIPIPTVADVVYQCTVFRRASAKNCPFVLAKVRKGDKRQTRFDDQSAARASTCGPPTDLFSVERYFVALSRLADSGDLRLQIQNLSGIRANQLRLCRVDEIIFSDDAKGSHALNPHRKVTVLADKDVPVGQPRKRGPNEENEGTPVTEIVAFEMTLNARAIEWNNGDNNDEEEDDDANGVDFSKSPKMAARLKRYLEVYGDEQECRLVDTESLTIAKAVSRSLWPRTSEELKMGLRVDAMDHRGNWFPGSVIEITENQGIASEEETGTGSPSTRRVRVHFDNFSSKWDEMYSIDHFTQGRVTPLYSHSIPKRKPTEFLVHHRHTDRQTGQLVLFGHSFYIQCQGEWSNARAGAHILAQVCRFMDYRTSSISCSDNGTNGEMETKALRLYEKTHSAISDLIDLLVDCDREYVKLALGVSQHNNAEEKSRPFRNPSFDASLLSSGLVKKVTGLLQRLPFELRISTVDGVHSDKPNTNVEEALFPFSLVRTIGNFMNIRHAVFLQWREPTVVDKKTPTSTASYRSFLSSPVMYVDPVVHVHEASAHLLNYDPSLGSKMKNKSNLATTSEPGVRGGIDLKYCLKEFCKVQKLSISDSWKCPMCKVHREGGQNMNLWRLPDLLTFHIKRFNMSARWHEKITTKVNFPLTGLDMRDFCHLDSPVLHDQVSESTVYDLIGVMNHYGSMTGGHYVATCKATACSKYGREEVAYGFNGVGASTCFEALSDSSNVVNTGSDSNSITGAWGRLGGGRSNKNQVEAANQNKALALMASRNAAESVEPTWLQFDDEAVEPIPPDAVCSEMAYVLFYRRRNLSSSNIAKYSTLE